MVHPSHNHIPDYQREGFRQSLGDLEGWQLVTGDKFSGSLEYRRGDETAIVPNVWYNQPVEWRIEAAQWVLDRQREALHALRNDPFPKPWQDYDIAQREKGIARQEAEIRKMIQTGYATF